MDDATTNIVPDGDATFALAEGVLRARPDVPFVPDGAALFPVAPSIDAAALADELIEELDRLAAAAVDDPLSNPILMLARLVSRRLGEGTLNLSAIEQVVHYLTAEGFIARARRLRVHLGEIDPAANDAALRRLIRSLAMGANGAPLPFETFRARVEHESFGIVVTAHPTFNLPGPLMAMLAELAAGRDGSGATLDRGGLETRMAAMRAVEHAPETMTLEREHEMSLAAVANGHAALRRAYGAVFEVAEELYPARWTELTPKLVSVASWVGYDLDGRSDIGWTDTLHKRLIDQSLRLAATLDELAAIRALAGAEQNPSELRAVLDPMAARLAAMREEVAGEIAVFGTVPSDAAHTRARIAEVSRRMVAGAETRIDRTAVLVEELARAAAIAASPPLKRRLLVLRAEIANSGLAMARVHVRINASQLHNAVRGAVALDSTPDDPRFRTSYLNKLEEMLAGVRTETINFGSIIAERASARRLFMVIAQMLKCVDRATPVRFLIAECESAFTVLSALYFAKLFGIEDRIDISPLFETQRALEVGSRVIGQLLKNPHFRDYVARRGRICVQTGYSDGGRYLGQLPAAVSIERFRMRLARVLAEHELPYVDVVVFDTHGESIGRGGHSDGLAAALAYVDTPASRQAFAAARVGLIEEVSFQGGDGYLPFYNASCAFAALTRILEHALTPPPDAADPFYDEADYVREAFTAATQFQVELMRDPDYGALLGGFAANFLYPSGSRPAVREHDDGTARIATAAELRAIPHNAALLQLGVAANVLGGLGEAIDRDTERFAAMMRASPRLASLAGVAAYARQVGSFDALGAYVATTAPALWLARAETTSDARQARRMRDVAVLLEAADLHDSQHRVERKLHRDFLALKEAWPATEVPEVRRKLAVLHALRVALIHEIYLLTTRVPDFAPQLGTSHSRIVLRLLNLDVPAAVAVLERIFPSDVRARGDAAEFGEPASYRGEDSRTYEAEHAEVFAPMLALYALVRRVSAAITHRIGFFG